MSHDEQQNLSCLLDKLSCAIQGILAGNLVGIYLHGSIAQKAFRWNVSDVDFLLVVQSEPSDDIKRQLLDTTLNLSEIARPRVLNGALSNGLTAFTCPIQSRFASTIPSRIRNAISHRRKNISKT